MALSAALKAAKRERMDLLPVAPHARPPVFRLGDANEAARQARLRERDSRKKEMENRRKTSMKEVGAVLHMQLCLYVVALSMSIPQIPSQGHADQAKCP